MSNKQKKNSYTSRLIAPMQSTGRCGKSTFIQSLIAYLQYAEVEHSAIDADGAHRTLSEWFPTVKEIPFNSALDLRAILNYCGSSPVEIIDFPAQATDAILEALKTYRAKQIFEEKGVRLTIPIFASDERVSVESAVKIIQATRSYADYIVVTNSCRFSSTAFLGSEKIMALLGDAPVVDMLPISQPTMEEIDGLSKARRKNLTLVEVQEGLPIASRMEVQTFVNSLYCAFEDTAETILPNVNLIKNKVSRDGGEKEVELEALSFFDL